MTDQLCTQCEQEARYTNDRTGKTYLSCAPCAWNALMKLFDYLEDEEKTAKEKIDNWLDYTPYQDWAHSDRGKAQ